MQSGEAVIQVRQKISHDFTPKYELMSDVFGNQRYTCPQTAELERCHPVMICVSKTGVQPEGLQK